GVLFSCKKVDHYAQLVNDQPFLVMGSLGFVPQGLPNYPGYIKSYIVGDTALFVGRLFLDKPGSVITVGKEAAKILFQTKVPAPDSINQYTGKGEYLDYVKFVITAGMG